MEKDNSKFIRMTTEPVQRLICTLAIPTIISGLYGMNVPSSGMPFGESRAGFAVVCAITLIICVAAMVVMKKKRML